MSDMIESGIPTPHEGQQKVLALPGRFKIAVCGRRFGKTVAAAIAAVQKCEREKNQIVWWICPIQDQSNRVERDVTYWLRERTSPPRSARKKKSDDATEPDESPDPSKPRWTYRASEHALECENGSRIEFHSAHTPDRLRGAGLDLAVIDEAADVSEYTWNTVIKPMLLDRRGEAFVVGTPRGKNHWLHKLYQLGQNPEHAASYSSIRLPTTANPLIPAKDLEEFRIDMTEDKYRQEFEAEFVDGVDTVFAGIDDCIKGEMLHTGRPGAKYITGIDLGQSIDFTVLCSLACDTKHVEGFARFNQMDWSVQERNILEHMKHFPGPAIVDATGNGNRIWESLRDSYRGHVERFVFTSQSRADILAGLQLGFSHRQLTIANIPELVEELRGFTQVGDIETNGIRRVRMSAPPGLHDDCVMSLAMTWWGMEKRGLWGIGTNGNPLNGRGFFA